MANALTPVERLEGLVPVAEDWHTKASLLGVSACNHVNVRSCMHDINFNLLCIGIMEATLLHQVTFRSLHTLPVEKHHQ